MLGGGVTRPGALVAVCLVLATAAVPAQEGRLELPSKVGDGVSLILDGDEREVSPEERLQVFVGPSSACCAGRSPMAGSYGVDAERLSFLPAFEFVKGQRYTLRILGNSETEEVTEFVVASDEPAVAPRVTAIFPSAETLPENTLRFYIRFSTPMQPHRAADFISLLDASGQRDDAAFMLFKQELWDESRTQLTVLMDPGRIKRGVAQNLSLGPALLEGRSYSLVVDAGWPAANGDQVAPGFEKHFDVSAPLRTLPEIDRWSVSRPRIGTRDPLIVVFDRPFDRQFLGSAITLLDEGGQAIDGRVQIEDDQTRWRFDPDEAWRGAQVDITVDAALEDVAGNNFLDLLDHDVGAVSETAPMLTRRVRLDRE